MVNNPVDSTSKKQPFKNHVGESGKTLKNELVKQFGDLLALRDKAMDMSNPDGQVKAFEEIGQKQIDSEFYINFVSPAIRESFTSYINATAQYNIDEGDFLTLAGQKGLEIRKVQAKTILGNTNFLNQKAENQLQFVNDKAYEQQRHNFAMSTIQLTGRIKMAIALVDSVARLRATSLQPVLRQIDANKQYQQSLISQGLKMGDKSDHNLVVRKDYTGVNQSAGNLLQKLGQRFGIHF